jgi:Protein of unknown function (DUF3551)
MHQEEETMLARTSLATLVLATVMMIEPHAANAAPYWPWCSQYFSRGAAHACAFTSWAQCMDTVRGIGGYCYANPYGPPPALGRSSKPSRHAARG